MYYIFKKNYSINLDYWNKFIFKLDWNNDLKSIN